MAEISRARVVTLGALAAGLWALVACGPPCQAHSHSLCGDAENVPAACGIPSVVLEFPGTCHDNVVSCQAQCTIAAPCSAIDPFNRDEETYNDWVGCLDRCEEGVDCAALDALWEKPDRGECPDHCLAR